jgi:hypothetical protein
LGGGIVPSEYPKIINKNAALQTVVMKIDYSLKAFEAWKRVARESDRFNFSAKIP